MLTFQNVTKVLNGREVLHDITLRIAPGEFVCLSGPREAGKTLILHLLLGVLRPTAGIVAVDGVDLLTLSPPLLRLYRRNVGIAFGVQSLLPDRNVAQNLAVPLEALTASSAEIAERVGQMLERMRLLHRSSSLPGDLTEGERQKTVLARALATDPKILLIDNIPLDIEEEEREEILDLLSEVNGGGTTIILATRDRSPWDRLCTRLLSLSNGTIAGDERPRSAEDVPLQHSRKERGVHITPTPVA